MGFFTTSCGKGGLSTRFWCLGVFFITALGRHVKMHLGRIAHELNSFSSGGEQYHSPSVSVLVETWGFSIVHFGSAGFVGNYGNVIATRSQIGSDSGWVRVIALHHIRDFL